MTKQERASIAEAKIRRSEEIAAAQIEHKAREVRASFLQVFPQLDRPLYYGAIDQYLKAVRRDEIINQAIEEMVAAKGAASVRPLMWEQAAKSARTVQQLGRELGLGPAAEAQLRLVRAAAFQEEHSAQSIAELAEQGAQLREQRGDVVEDASTEEEGSRR